MFHRATRRNRRRETPSTRIERAVGMALEPLESRMLLTVDVTGVPNWFEQGPGPIHGGQGAGIPNQPVTGAITSIAAHPRAFTFWVGTVGGGIWKSTDDGVTWQPKTDQFPSLNISTIVQDPVDMGTLWAGTGKTSSSLEEGKKIGLLKSIDGGETWRINPGVLATDTINAIVPTRIPQGSGRVVLVGGLGLFRSTDGGLGRFQQVKVNPIVGAPDGVVTDIKADPANDQRFYAAMAGQGVFVSDDGGLTWANATQGATPSGVTMANAIVIKLSVSDAKAANTHHPVYAGIIERVQERLTSLPPAPNKIDVGEHSLIAVGDTITLVDSAGKEEERKVIAQDLIGLGGERRLTLSAALTNTYQTGNVIRADHTERVSAILRSDDHGQTWASLGRPGDLDGGIHPGGQGDKHFSLLADKLDPLGVYVGGDRQPKAGPDGLEGTTDDAWPNETGAQTYHGRLFRGTFDLTSKTTNWKPITNKGANGTAPHADSRFLAYDTNDHILEADDGGLFRLRSPHSDSLRRWESRNGNLRLTEFISVAWQDTGSRIIGGSQDNGVAVQPFLGSGTWTAIGGGDGGVVEAIGADLLFSSQNFSGFRVGNRVAKLVVQNTGGMTLENFDKSLQFYQPYVLNSVAPNRMLIGTSYLYESEGSNLGDSLTPLGGKPQKNGSSFSPNASALVGAVSRNAMVYGGMDHIIPNPDVGWVGTAGAGGKYLYVRQGGKGTGFTHVSSWRLGTNAPDAKVLAIAIDPTNWRHVYVLDDKRRVWFSDDGGKDPRFINDATDPTKWHWEELTNQTNNLQDLPGAENFKEIAVHRTSTHIVILVGGQGGLFRRIDAIGGAKGRWHEYGGGPLDPDGTLVPHGGGLPNALVTDIDFVPAPHSRVVVGTMGRGAFTAPLADLATPGRVSIVGSASNDLIKLVRDQLRPWLLNIFEYPVGTTPEPQPKQVPLASIDEISIQGGAGSDQIIIDYSNGPINVPNLISIDGGSVFSGETDSLSFPVPTNPLRRAVAAPATIPVGAFQQTTIVSKDPFGQQGNQVVLWKGMETTPVRAQLAPALVGVGAAFASISNTSRQGAINAGRQTKGAGPIKVQSLVAGLHGRKIARPRPKDDRFDITAINRNASEVQLDNVTSIFRRLIEEGPNAFSLDLLGMEGGAINDLPALRSALDALDSIPGNVTLDTSKDVDGDGATDSVFTTQILNRRLGGIVDLDVDANIPLGEVQLSGPIEIDSEVDVNLVFGIDGSGFFLRPSAPGTPAIRVSDLKVAGDVAATGRFGFLGVELTGATIAVDPDVGVEFNFLDPGTGADADAKIRIEEFSAADASNVVTINVNGDPGDGTDDIVLNGKFAVSASVGSDLAPLFDVDAQLRWSDLADVTSVSLTADATSKLNAFFDIDAVDFINHLTGAAEQIRGATGVDVFAMKIPLLEKSVNDILGGTVEETLTDTQIAEIDAVISDAASKKFRVMLDNVDARTRGIAPGNAVTFKGTDNAEHAGTIDSVDHTGFVISFDLANPAQPLAGADALIKVTREASPRDMIESWLGELADPVDLSARVPTIQEMAAALGVDLSAVKLSDANDAIEIPFTFKLDPIHFSHKLDLGGSIAGLNLSAGGDIDVEISPTFAFTAGVRFTSGVPLAERIYLKENADPEVTLGLKVTLDNPTASGSIGFLNVALSEDGSGDNDGISFLGQLKLNLTDPGSGAADDGRIVLAELTPGNLISSIDADISADFVINPLIIAASVGDSTDLGNITIKLDAADGHVASLADLSNLPSKIQIAGASNFANFQNITPQMIIDALQALIERLRALGGGGVLDTKLPIIDKSLSEIVDLGEELAGRLGVLGPDGVATAGALELLLEEKLATLLGPGVVNVTVKSDAIQFSLSFTEELAESLPVSLNLGDSFGLLKVEGGGVVNFTGAATANVTFGLLTGAGIPIAQRLYFDTDGADASKISINGNANIGYGGGSDPGFDATVKLAFLEFGIPDARAMIELSEMLGQLKDPGDSAGEGAGRLTFQEIADKITAGDFTDILDGSYTGRVQARIPLDGNGGGVNDPLDSADALIEVAGKLENLTSGLTFNVDPGLHADSSTPLTLEELSDGIYAGKFLVHQHNLDTLITNAVLDFDNLIAGLEKLIEWGDKLLGLGVLDFELPFTGAKIRDAINFFKDPNGPLRKLIDVISASDGMGSNPSDGFAAIAAGEIEDALAGIQGLSPIVEGGNILKLQHLNNDPNGPLTGATFKFRYSLPFNLPLANPQFDLGLDFFKLQSDVALSITGFVDVMLGLGIDKSTGGFYLITEFPEAPANTPEFSLRNLRIAANGNATVDVGFLELGAVFDLAKNFIQANFSVDLNGLDDDRLTLAELADFANLPAIIDPNPLTPEQDGLKFTAEAKMDVPLTLASHPDFPSLSSNFVLQWGPFTLNDIRGGTPAFTTPLVALNDLTLNAGEFLSKQALPFFQRLQQYNVLAPLIDKLDDPLPVVGGTLFDLLVTNNPALSQQQKDIAGFLFNVGKTINDFSAGIDAGGDDLLLNFGDITINRDQSVTTSSGAVVPSSGVTPSANGPYPGQSLPFVGGLIEDMGDIGIVFPMLDVGNLVQLFMGNDVDLIFAAPPQLHAGKTFEGTVPIYSIGIPYIGSASINATFGGSIDLYVNLAAGLDSSGIKKGMSSILDGLYIGDFDPGSDGKIGPGDAERPEVLIEGSVTAGIDGRASLFGFDILKVSGKASIGGSVGLDLNDDNDHIDPPLDPRELAERSDGKFYIGEIQTVVNSAGGDVFCMFDIVGEVFAKLAFEISVPWAPNPGWSHRWTLLEFDVECEPDPIFPDFADIVDDGAGGAKLLLTSTPGDSHVAYHSFSATNHADGDPIEIFLIDKNGDADDGLETLRIRKHGFTEDFGPGESGNNFIEDVTTLTLITDEGTGTGKFALGDFGVGPDSVLIDAAIRIPVRLDGGTENDTLTGGNGGGTLLGGDGDDYLAVGEAPTGLSAAERALRSTFFNGGNGFDQIVGGVGHDVAIGAEGNDTVDGGEGDDILVGGGGDDVLDGGANFDRIIGDYDESGYVRPASGAEEGSDFISGGTGVDIIWGDNRGTTNTVDGPAPDASRDGLTGDFIFSGDGSDLVFAGAGNDRVEAGAADAAEPNRVFGGTGDDVILGGANRDSLVGQAGNDDIDAGAADDKLYAGDDTFGPNASNMGFDRLTGGEGADLLDGSDANSVTAYGDAGVDSIVGSRGGDDLSGGAERDFILAGPGNDLVSGGEGDDDVLGGDGTVGGFTVDFTELDGADSITGEAGNDVLLGDNGSINATTRATSTTESGGFGIDTVAGGAGSDSILGGGAGDRLDGGSEADLIFGDHGSINPALPANVNFTSTHATATSGGGGGDDTITGDTGDDTAIGGQGADQIAGGADNDDLIGGHNITGGHDGADAIDGDAGYDVIAGDNAAIVRRTDNQSRNTRALAGATLYNSAGLPNVTGNFQVNLDGAVGRDVTLFDHTATTNAALFGDDNLAGGAGHDSVFGQLGNDRMQGDGATALNVSASTPSASAATDGNDYMEGGGGNDLMFGNLGQDDLIGGSSSLFGLADGHRPDGADVIFGGSGDDVLRNALGDTTPGGHARDADVILGDNGNIFRIVSADGAGTYATFNYDNYAGDLRIIPRAVQLLDYSADGDATNDIGGGDRLHGEAGDDSVHGMSGNDMLTGDGQDDHLFGESGDDWLSGGAGDDGLLGDDGKIMTSRNGIAEPLYGIAATTQQAIAVKSLQLAATLNVTGRLNHAVDLEPFDIGGADVMYGGLGNDAMHGGAGQDLMSGAEAMAEFYLPALTPALAFVGGKFEVFDFNAPRALIVGHPLNFDAGTPDNIVHDGDDVLFGDGGNDWLVGGTDTDRLYGGYGDDVMNADDNLETDGGANNSPDAGPYAGADYAFGGAGRDTMIGNAPEDRLIDWVGEFNNYYVPFNPFGQSTVVRQISPQLIEFLYRLSRSNGADQTRIGPGLGAAARNGEPFGELGLVIQQDRDWHDQIGGPVGPQPQ